MGTLETARQWREDLRKTFLWQSVVPHALEEIVRDRDCGHELEDVRTFVTLHVSPMSWKLNVLKGCLDQSLRMDGRPNIFKDLTISHATAVELLQEFAQAVSFLKYSGDICFGLLTSTDAPTWVLGNHEYVQLRDGVLLLFGRDSKRGKCTVTRMTDDATLLKWRLLPLLMEAMEAAEIGSDSAREVSAMSRLERLFWEAWDSREKDAQARFDEAMLVWQEFDAPSAGYVSPHKGGVRAYVMGDDGKLSHDPNVRCIFATPTSRRDSQAVLQWVENRTPASLTCLSYTDPEDLTVLRKGVLGSKRVPFLDLVSDALRQHDIPQVIDWHGTGRVFAYTHPELVEH
jgi:hypothetical protein